MKLKKKTVSLILSLLVVGVTLILQGLPRTEVGKTTANEVTPPALVQTPPVPSSIPSEATSSVTIDTTGLTTAQVTRVVDGDTIEVNLNGQIQKVRYLGMNTPETVDPRRGVQCFGHEASDENKKLVEGKQVILTKDISDTDKYGRLLRFVYLPISGNEMLFVNDYLVREGYAQIDTYPPDVKFADRFLAAQKQAQAQNKGLWGKCK